MWCYLWGRWSCLFCRSQHGLNCWRKKSCSGRMWSLTRERTATAAVMCPNSFSTKSTMIWECAFILATIQTWGPCRMGRRYGRPLYLALPVLIEVSAMGPSWNFWKLMAIPKDWSKWAVRSRCSSRGCVGSSLLPTNHWCTGKWSHLLFLCIYVYMYIYFLKLDPLQK